MRTKGGIDTLDFSGTNDAVTVTLDGVANDGEVGETENVRGTENLIGSYGSGQRPYTRR